MLWETESLTKSSYSRCNAGRFVTNLASFAPLSLKCQHVDRPPPHPQRISKACFAVVLFLDSALCSRSAFLYPWSDPVSTSRCHQGATVLVCVLWECCSASCSLILDIYWAAYCIALHIVCAICLEHHPTTLAEKSFYVVCVCLKLLGTAHIYAKDRTILICHACVKYVK